jgi:DNA modification methylase
VGTRLMLGDCLIRLKELPDNSVDSIVTDPPYGLSFMGKKWDYDVPSVEIWQQCLRVLKPGGHLLAFAGTRTQHRMAVRIEDAGFEIRDMIAWVYGSGFPKSLDVSKAIDKAAGAEREVIGVSENVRPESDRGNGLAHGDYGRVWNETTPTTDAAKQWQGWGTALKPSLEPITVARKPLIGTVADNVLQHGTGGINIDGCRVGSESITTNINTTTQGGKFGGGIERGSLAQESTTHTGRWPANFIHDGSEGVVGLFPNNNPSCKSPSKAKPESKFRPRQGTYQPQGPIYAGDNGTSAAKFFYCAKASKKDRGQGNNHPTVKPTALMQYLCRLVTPSKGTVLDPFMGSGSTAVACVREKFNFIGVEMLREHFETAKNRIVTERKAQS